MFSAFSNAKVKFGCSQIGGEGIGAHKKLIAFEGLDHPHIQPSNLISPLICFVFFKN
jgi:hypothetical protein